MVLLSSVPLCLGCGCLATVQSKRIKTPWGSMGNACRHPLAGWNAAAATCLAPRPGPEARGTQQSSRQDRAVTRGPGPKSYANKGVPFPSGSPRPPVTVQVWTWLLGKKEGC